MRRFELVEGTSSKFWEIALSGTSFEVRWGRIGTSGQSQTKSFPTEAKALAEHDKLVKEKTGKGYVEVGAAASGTGTGTGSGTGTGTRAKPSTKEPVAPPAIEPIDEPPAPVALPPRALVLTDPRTWPAELRALVQPRPAWAEPAPALDHDAIWKKLRERAAKAKATPDDKSPGRVAARTRLSPIEAPAEPAPSETEIGLALLVAGSANAWGDAAWIAQGIALAIDHWCATGGPRHALLSYAALVRAGLQWTAYADHAAVRRLGAHLAPISEPERRALSELEGVRDHAFLHQRMRLFPELREADRSLQAGNAAGGNELESVTELASLATLGNARSLWSLKTGARYGNMSARPVLYTWIACFGDAVLPTLVKCLELEGDAETHREVAEAIAFVGTPAAFEILAARAADRNMLQALREGALARPSAALAALVTMALQRGGASAPCRTILTQLLRTPGSELDAGLAALGEGGRKLIAELRDKSAVADEASEAELPRFLVSPPWLDRKKKSAAGTVEGLAPLAFEEAMAWPPELEAAARKYAEPAWYASQVAAPNFFMEHWGIPRDLAERLGARDDAADDAALAAGARSRTARWFTAYGGYLTSLPPRLARKLITTFAAERWYSEVPAFQRLAADHGLSFLDPFLAYARSHLDSGLEVLLPYRSPRVAILAADALYRLKKKPPAARQWLLLHPEAAAIGLVPLAVGKAGKTRDAAEHGLRALASEGQEALVMEVAARHGAAAEAAVRAVLDFDPLELFPSKIPAVPDFASAAALPRLVLRASGRALPVSAMQHVLTMLAISKPGEPYAGVLRLKELCTPASLGELAWELFSSWNVAGAPSKEGWAFTAMGLIGDDECARRITPLVRAWPGESQHQRAVAGLDVLASIGSDVALMHLHGIAQKLKFKGLQEKAREKIDQIAEARGLSADELADRLVPDLGLDEDGSLTLDFGPRRFRVAFDEALKPLVRDEEGKRLADLPKPRKDDDADKSAAAVDAWKALKKDAKTIAQTQVTRLELAMCGRRRWSPEVFQRFLVEHPLVRHLAVRLAWGAYGPDGALLSVFRVAEDGSYASVDDDAYALPEGAEIGVAHTLETRPEDEAKLGQVFGDYELVQPFVQLGRETFRLSDEETKRGTIERWKGKKVPTGKVLGLEARGWRRGPPQDAGHIGWMEKEIGGEVVSLDLDPGISVGMIDLFPEQEVVGLGIGADFRWRKDARKSLASLHPIVVSELIRDVEKMVG